LINWEKSFEKISIEELVVEILSKALSVSLDPSERFEFHFKLAEKFLSEAEELLAKGDYIQASGKLGSSYTNC